MDVKKRKKFLQMANEFGFTVIINLTNMQNLYSTLKEIVTEYIVFFNGGQ